MNILSRFLFRLPGGQSLGGLYLIAFVLVITLLWATAHSVVAQESELPNQPPDTETGLAIYADRCANCHGPFGQGDGELAPNLPNPPTAHGSAEYLQTAVPVEMFDVITSGRIPQGMPPFGQDSSDPLSDADRWDLIATLYSFGTPVENVEAGQLVYEENCLACHGEDGRGDGPEAAGLDTAPGDLAEIGFWFNISNQNVFDSLANVNQIKEHAYELDDEALRSVVDYMRTFSYGYADVLAALRPLETASVSGQAINASTGEPLADETTALLRAFTRDLNITLTMSQTLNAEGYYLFDLEDVPQDWFFRISLTHDDVEFGSDFGQVTFDQPELDLPVTVYNKTSDPSRITIQQMHTFLDFSDDQLTVSELYVVSNEDNTVFVGESGDPAGGTFEFSVPEGADQLIFQRGFGSIDSFIPATEIIETNSGWADTLPLRPGPGSLTLLVQYSLPYDGEVAFAHPLNYATFSVNLVLPDVGVTLDESSGWVNGGTQAMEGGSVTSYQQMALPAGSELVLNLEGQPRAGGISTTNLVSDNALELVLGVAAALVVVGIAAVVIRRWQLDSGDEILDRDELLQEIADLDDAYDAGEISETDYQRDREAILADLKAIWETDPAE